jgi:hypothetical protein
MGSSTNSSFSEPLNYFYVHDERGLQHQQQQQQQNEYATPNLSNPFAPIGYSRQRSTSLLPPSASQHYLGPPIQHLRQQQHQQQQSQQRQQELKQPVSAPLYPYGMSTSRMGIGSSTHDHYLNNSRFCPSLDSKCITTRNWAHPNNQF